MKEINPKDHVLYIHSHQHGLWSPNLATLAAKTQHFSYRKSPELCILYNP